MPTPFVIPDPNQSTPLISHHLEANSKAYAKPLILVVDDTPANAHVLYEIFKEDCEVCLATGGQQALDFCVSRRPDLILLDIVMPGMSGHAVCRQLKDNPATQEIPIIFITALHDPEEEASGFEAGIVDFITKPFHSRVVRARVNTQLLLRRQTEQLRALALTDGLTGLFNRRQFDITLQTEWLRCARESMPLGLILIDVDFFKRYNDRHGHPAGDACLRLVAEAIRQRLGRPGDFIARYGGEEFTCLLPNTSLKGAQHVAGDLLAAVRSLAIPHADSDTADIVTISLGVAVTVPRRTAPPGDLLLGADEALYEAKRTGRSRLCVRQI